VDLAYVCSNSGFKLAENGWVGKYVKRAWSSGSQFELGDLITLDADFYVGYTTNPNVEEARWDKSGISV